MIETTILSRGRTRRRRRRLLGLSTAAMWMKERKAMPKFGAPARRRLLFGWPHGTVGAALFAALAFLGWQTPTAASSRGLQIAAGPQSWRSAQARSEERRVG